LSILITPFSLLFYPFNSILKAGLGISDNDQAHLPPTGWAQTFEKPLNFDRAQNFEKTTTLLAVRCSDWLGKYLHPASVFLSTFPTELLLNQI
jgi:hypothetical protein